MTLFIRTSSIDRLAKNAADHANDVKDCLQKHWVAWDRTMLLVNSSAQLTMPGAYYLQRFITDMMTSFGQWHFGVMQPAQEVQTLSHDTMNSDIVIQPALEMDAAHVHGLEPPTQRTVAPLPDQQNYNGQTIKKRFVENFIACPDKTTLDRFGYNVFYRELAQKYPTLFKEKSAPWSSQGKIQRDLMIVDKIEDLSASEKRPWLILAEADQLGDPQSAHRPSMLEMLLQSQRQIITVTLHREAEGLALRNAIEAREHVRGRLGQVTIKNYIAHLDVMIEDNQSGLREKTGFDKTLWDNLHDMQNWNEIMQDEDGDVKALLDPPGLKL